MSSTPSSNATYVPGEECIHIAPTSDSTIASSSLPTSIVGIGLHNDRPSFTSASPFLLAEIEEITILDNNMNTIATHDKSTHPRYSIAKSSDQTKETLLKRRDDLQRRHDVQYRGLLDKHRGERMAVENHAAFSEEEMDYILTNVMEPMHQKQLRLMKERHQEEQAVLMDFMFKSAFGSDATTSNNNDSDEGEMPANKTHKDSNGNKSSHTSTSSELGTIDESSTGTSVDGSSVSSSISSHRHTATLDPTLSPVPESPNPESSPVYLAIQQVKLNDPSYETIDLGGNDVTISAKVWKNLFRALETNTHVTRVYLQDCGLTDETIVPLLLSLIENDSISVIDLSMNEELTDETGKMLIKVLNGGNERVCNVDLGGTGVSAEIVREVEDILSRRVTVDVV